MGLGGIGLSAIIGARMVGASRIIGIDINESKFDPILHSRLNLQKINRCLGLLDALKTKVCMRC